MFKQSPTISPGNALHSGLNGSLAICAGYENRAYPRLVIQETPVRRWTKLLHNIFRILADIHFLLLMLGSFIFAVIEFWHFVSRITH